MRNIVKLIVLFLMLFALTSPAFAQESNTFQSDLNAVFATVLIVVVIVFGVLSGSLLYVILAISKNPIILQAAERSYDNARKDTQDLVKMLHTSLELAERLATSVVPADSNIAIGIDKAEDILEEIVDGEPFNPNDANSAETT